jgi:hypothetical protein
MRLGTKARLLEAIRVFYAQSPREFINPHSQITVEKFATKKSIVSSASGRADDADCEDPVRNRDHYRLSPVAL